VLVVVRHERLKRDEENKAREDIVDWEVSESSV